jgi:hypothetical protein
MLPVGAVVVVDDDEVRRLLTQDLREAIRGLVEIRLPERGRIVVGRLADHAAVAVVEELDA